MTQKLPLNKVLIAVLVVTVLLVAFQNCSPKTSFKQADVASTAAQTTLPDPVDPPDTPVTPIQEIPKYSLMKIGGVAGGDSESIVILSKVAEADFSFDWATNDTAYLQDTTGRIGHPNVHYVAAQKGKVVILKGQDRFTIKIRTINWQSNAQEEEKEIPYRISNCRYGDKVLSCKDIRE